MTMMREHQMNHSIWADTMEIAANRMQEGLIKAEAKKDKELEGLDTDRSTLQGQINGLKEDLEASERSGARLDAQVNGLKSALAEATSNREEQMAGVVSERDQALTDLAFSEKTRFQLRRQLEEEAKTRAGLESELRKVKERLALDAGDLAVLRQAEAARELLRHKSVGVQYAPRPPDLDLPPSSTPTHSPLPPPSA
jgi:chromosome segregation ATPase